MELLFLRNAAWLLSYSNYGLLQPGRKRNLPTSFACDNFILPCPLVSCVECQAWELLWAWCTTKRTRSCRFIRAKQAYLKEPHKTMTVLRLAAEWAAHMNHMNMLRPKEPQTLLLLLRESIPAEVRLDSTQNSKPYSNCMRTCTTRIHKMSKQLCTITTNLKGTCLANKIYYNYWLGTIGSS